MNENIEIEYEEEIIIQLDEVEIIERDSDDEVECIDLLTLYNLAKI